MALDQGAFAPAFQGIFLSVLGATQGKNLAEINQKLKAEYVDIMLTGWKVGLFSEPSHSMT